MDSNHSFTSAIEDQTVVVKPEHSAPLTAISARLWTYGGSRGRLRDVNLEPESMLAEMLNALVQESEGKLAGTRQSTLVAHFENPLRALAGAKLLQQKLLSIPKAAEDEQFAAAIVVHGWGAEDASGSTTGSREALVPKRRLIEANLGRILVTAGIREMAREVPEFEFNPAPVPKGDGGSSTGSIYELYWTDPDTYARVRKAAQSAGRRLPTLSRYELISELGRGSMGVVYRATDKLIGRTVALKTISVAHSGNSDQEELVERLRLEAKTAGQLDHPNIITIFDVGQEEDLVYLSMQFVEGTTLADLLTEGKLPPVSTLLSYADQICAAVGFAHEKGVIHRDLKPANVMVTPQGQVKVLDFGIAKLGDVSLTQSGLVVGTPTHMSPEQAMGRKLDQRSDIFSLGAVFYEVFTRERPFKGDISAIFYKIIHEEPTPPAVINPSLPIGIDAIIRKALAKDPKLRYQSCEELRAAFREQATLLAAVSGSPASSAAPAPIPVSKQPGVPQHTGIPPLPRVATANKGVRPPARGNVARNLLLLCLLVVSGILALQLRPDWKAVAIAQWKKLMATSTNQLHAQDNSQPTGQGVTTQAATNTGSGSVSTAGSAAMMTTTAGNSATGSGTMALSGSASTGSLSAAATPEDGTTMTPDAGPPATNPGAAANGSNSVSDNTDASGSTAATEIDAAKKNHKRGHTGPADVVRTTDGWTRKDIPDLLGKAQKYKADGNADMARYTYGQVLLLDHSNQAAKAGLRDLQ